MVTEAGGCISDLEGKEHTLDSESSVVSNGFIHADMLDILVEPVEGENPL